MTVLEPDQMDLAVATVAVHAFAAANLDSMMPRGPMLAPEAPEPATSMEAMMQQLAEGAGLTAVLTAVLGVLVGVCLGCCLKKNKPALSASPDEMKRMLQDE